MNEHESFRGESYEEWLEGRVEELRNENMLLRGSLSDVHNIASSHRPGFRPVEEKFVNAVKGIHDKLTKAINLADFAFAKPHDGFPVDEIISLVQHARIEAMMMWDLFPSVLNDYRLLFKFASRLRSSVVEVERNLDDIRAFAQRHNEERTEESLYALTLALTYTTALLLSAKIISLRFTDAAGMMSKVQR